MRMRIDNAYMAGIVDGEGFFVIYKQQGSFLLPILSIFNTCKRLSIWMESKYGGNIQHHPERSDSTRVRKEGWMWWLSGEKRLHPVVSDLLPYLIIKEKQALVIHKLCLLLEQSRPQHKFDPEGQESLYKQIRVLNRGVSR